MITTLQPLVDDLKPAFTEPSFATGCHLLLAWVMCLGKHTLFRLACHTRPDSEPDHSKRHGLDREYNFFERSSWAPQELARAFSLRTSPTLTSMLLEVAGLTLIGSSLALVSLCVVDLPFLFPGSSRTALVRIVAVASLSLVVVLGTGLLWVRLDLASASLLRLSSCLSLSAAIYVVDFALYGLILDLLALFVFGVSESHLFLFTGLFAIAWLSGFITPGAPAGLGVREFLLALLLRPFLGEAVAINLTLLVRFLHVLADGLAFTMGVWTRPASTPSRG